MLGDLTTFEKLSNLSLKEMLESSSRSHAGAWKREEGGESSGLVLTLKVWF